MLGTGLPPLIGRGLRSAADFKLGGEGARKRMEGKSKRGERGRARQKMIGESDAPGDVMSGARRTAESFTPFQRSTKKRSVGLCVIYFETLSGLSLTRLQAGVTLARGSVT